MTTQKSYFPDFSQDGDTYYDTNGAKYKADYMKTNNKYKVGDEVLVRAKISGMADDKYYLDGSYQIYHLEKDIYSLAPEFNYGEEIEVSDDGKDWLNKKFIYSNYSIADGRIEYIVDCGRWLKARKIQPTKEENILMFEGKKYKLVEE